MADSDVDDNALADEWADLAEGDDGDDEDGASNPGLNQGEDEWADLAEGDDGDDEDGASNPGLNQGEIDSLLGFDSDDDAEPTGIAAIVNSALVSYERLPMLEVVFDRLVRMMTTSLRNFTSDNVEVSLEDITSIRFGDYLDTISLPAMLGVFRAVEWDNFGMLTVESGLIYSIVDVLLGGRRGSAALRAEERAYTTIERELVERMIRVVLADMSAAFEPLSPVTFSFDRLETNPRFATIARPVNAAILVKLRVAMEDRGGRIEMMLPYATLEPVRELLLQMFMGEKFGRDSIWEGHLATELWSTNIDLEAVLEQRSMLLGEAMALEVGNTVLLSAKPQDPVILRCGGIDLLQGSMGRSESGAIAIRVVGPVPKEDNSL